MRNNQKTKNAARILSVITACTMISSMMAVGANAVSDRKNQIRILVENNTLSSADGADWTGVLLDEWIEINEDTTAAGAFLTALDRHGYTQTGADIDYITEINGLSSEDGGSMGGWMVSLDNWITDEAISAYTVSSGKLEGGDEITFSYSCSWGADLGYDWSGNDTSLKEIKLSEGILTPEFSSETREYVLTIPEETERITVKPFTTNRGYRAKVYKNEYTPAEKGSDYKPSEEIEVKDGDVIVIGVANPAWMQSNYNNAQESIYTIHINEKAQETDLRIQETESLISAIGEVTKNSGRLIEAARTSYDALNEEQQMKVSNYDVLLSAEKAYAEILNNADVMMPEAFRSLLAGTEDDAFTYGNEWDVINLCRFGLSTEKNRQDYIQSVRKAVTEAGKEKLSATRSTVNSGVITALTACGADPQNFYGFNLLKPLSDYDYILKQGINGAVYALIAMDTCHYDVPKAEADQTQTTREKMITAILNEQQEDGGWTIDTWSGTDDGSDADMTAMALQALAPYVTENGAVRTAVEKALTYLSSIQNEKGQLRSYGYYDCESCAQVLTALYELSCDAENDPRFIKNNSSVYDGLMIFYQDAKGFSHFEDGEANHISTYQAYMGIISRYRFENKMTSYFDMTDQTLVVYKDEEQSDQNSEVSTASDDDSTEKEVSKPDAKVPSTGDSESVQIMLSVFALMSFICLAVIKRRDSE